MRKWKKPLILLLLAIFVLCIIILLHLNVIPIAIGLVISGIVTGGMAISFINIRGYRELYTAKEFYDGSIDVHHKSSEVRITSLTPGVVLASEYDPPHFPYLTQKKYRFRKRYFQSLLQLSKCGLKVKYFFDKNNAGFILKHYRQQNLQKYIDEGKRILARFLSETDSNFEIRCGHVTKKFEEATIIGDEFIVYSEREKEEIRKIRHGRIVRDKEEARRLREEFDREQWQVGQQVTDTGFIEELLRNPRG